MELQCGALKDKWGMMKGTRGILYTIFFSADLELEAGFFWFLVNLCLHREFYLFLDNCPPPLSLDGVYGLERVAWPL